MVISIASTKGGVGKSTLAINLAVALTELGKPVFMIDADRQGTLSAWEAARDAASLSPIRIVSASGETLAELASEKSQNGSIVIIDTAGADTKGTRYAVGVADAILTASTPTPADLWEIGRLENMIRDIAKRLGQRPSPWFLAINRAHPSTKDFSFVTDYLSESSIYPTAIFKTVIRQRSAYSDAIGWGKGATEFGDMKAQKEVFALAEELLTLLDNG